MSALQIVATVLVVLPLVFLMTAYFAKDELGHARRVILPFICAICAGFAGALFVGDALFEWKQDWPSGTKVAVAGTTGFALFLFTAFWLRGVLKVESKPPVPPPPPDGVAISIGENWTFEQSAQAIAELDGDVAEFVGFEEKELKTVLKAKRIERKTVRELLEVLGALAATGTFPTYDVTRDHRGYHVRKR
jgi:hypothetical protein